MTQPTGSGAPTPVAGVTGGPGLPQGVASVDGGTGNVIISPPSNTIEQKKSGSPQALLVYEYFNSNTDFVRIGLQTQLGGPEQIGVAVQPPGVIRDLYITTPGTLVIGSTANAGLAFETNATVRWQVGPGGNLLPSPDLGVSIGAVTSRVGTVFTSNLALTTILPTGTAATMLGGSGIPSAGIGANGDYFFRNDTPATALQRIYVKSAGAWVGIV